MKCTYCKEEIQDDAIKCKHCGSIVNKQAANQIGAVPVDPNEKPFFKEKFAKFDQAGGFVATWNWPAFFFGIFWYPCKGMWLKPLVYLLPACIIATFLTPIPVWIAFGILANYDYYLFKVKNKSLW